MPMSPWNHPGSRSLCELMPQMRHDNMANALRLVVSACRCRGRMPTPGRHRGGAAVSRACDSGRSDHRCVPILLQSRTPADVSDSPAIWVDGGEG